MALAFRIREERRVALAWCGDGAAARGDAHEGMNLAGVRRLPVVFLIDNNQWAYSTPSHLEYAVEHLADGRPHDLHGCERPRLSSGRRDVDRISGLCLEERLLLRPNLCAQLLESEPDAGISNGGREHDHDEHVRHRSSRFAHALYLFRHRGCPFPRSL